MKSIVLMSALAAVIAAQGAIAQQVHYLPDTIRSWPEPSRSRALSLLNECKPAADAFVKVWLTEDDPAIYAAASRELRQRDTFDDFRQQVEGMRQMFGSARSAEYRNHSLLLGPDDHPERMLDPGVQVVYRAQTSKDVKGLFLEIYLARGGGLCRVVGVRYQQYWTAVPPWLREPPRL